LTGYLNAISEKADVEKPTVESHQIGNNSLFWGHAIVLALISFCWVDLLIRDVMDWVVWALECNRQGQLHVMRVRFGAFLVDSSCLIAFWEGR
jgi:hypothetical protein